MSTDRPRMGPWPLIAGALGSVLLLAVLPSPLFTPVRHTPAAAEYAPVPGAPDARAANFRAAVPPSSDGVGASSRAGSLGSPPARSMIEFSPRHKQCVGIPPRQTEDLLSPPCVPFFDGKNGGATSQGVTEDEIEVVVYSDHVDHVVDLTRPWSPSDEGPAGQDQSTTHDPTGTQYHFIRTLKAHLRWFQQRYQTYGRTVRAIAAPSRRPSSADIDGGASECTRARNDAQDIAAQRPFAVLHIGYWGSRCFRGITLRSGSMSFGMHYDVARSEYLEHAPLLWGFFPDQETTAAASASFICNSLVGRPARFSGDPVLRTQTRRFGLVIDNMDGYDRSLERIARLTKRWMRETCGATFADERAYTSVEEGAHIAAQFKQDGVTTFVCACRYDHKGVWQGGMSGINYYPEWYWDTTRAAPVHFIYGYGQDHTQIGITPRWRQPAFAHQQHYRAYKQIEPGSGGPNHFSFESYHTFHLLFSAIQTAGPHLRPDNVRKGMFTLNLVEPDNPWTASGGWGSYGLRATGPYTYLDSFMAYRYSHAAAAAAGYPPGDCWLLALGGRRFFAGEWPIGDAMFEPADPCAESEVPLVSG